MSFGSYSTTPASNISINGVNIAENCAAGNVNDVIRQIAADGRELYDIVAAIDVSSYMPLTGGAFTGNVTRSGNGAMLYHLSSTMVTGAVVTQPLATALPSSPSEGMIVFQY